MRTPPPSRIAALVAKGIALHQRGNIKKAEAIYRDILRTDPNFFDALNLLGVLRMQRGELRSAEELLRKAVALKPDFAPVQLNLATLLQVTGKHAEALPHAQMATRLDPYNAHAWSLVGQCAGEAGDIDLAIDAFARAHKLGPSDSLTLSSLVELKRLTFDWENLPALESKLVEAIEQGAPVEPFVLLHTHDRPDLHLKNAHAYARSFATKMFGGTVAPPRKAKPSHERRLRVGYFSADFNDHAVGYQICGLIERHDRERFEVIGISYGGDDGRSVRKRLVAGFDRFVDIQGLGSREAIAAVAALDLDIAMDLMGYTKHARFQLLASRPAPVQATYIGYWAPLSLPFIDYMFADAATVPSEARCFYEEKIVEMPVSVMVTDNARGDVQDFGSRADHGLPDDAFVFCCFNKSTKISPEIFEIWMRLLDQVERSVLWLVEPSSGSGRLTANATRRGIDPKRIVLAPRTEMPKYLAQFRHADLFLDTHPYSGHATATDALWAGLPILTWAGSSFVSRVSMSQLLAVGLCELIVDSAETYERLAVELARDPDRLAALKRTLAGNRHSAPLFDTDQFARNIEAAYERMHQRAVDGLPPESFSIAAPR